MASTSASSVQKSFTYDVFLSFRGEDTRKTFVDHLYHALQQKGITTYKDDEKIQKGERISDQLLRSIKESKFHIIVFSKNYASSSWCLDELVEIMKCQNTEEQTAYPVFYDVEPTEVRKQSGAVGESFEKHVEKEAAGIWRDALKQASNLAGWELKNTVDGHEAKFIEIILKEILPKLYFINLRLDEKLVGMEMRVKEILSSLELGSDDVRMIGIKGMGGAGKTTLARAVFDHISVRFEGKSFVENVREVSKSSSKGLKKLQKQVLSSVLSDQSIVIHGVSDGIYMMKKMMPSKKALIVLDDVDNMDQLEALAGNPSWFKLGSRIIITTRDEQVLVAHRVKVINVNLLSDEEAISLFRRYAFGREIPLQGYEEKSEKVVHYAAGLPLTIKVLGSHLYGRSEHEWADTLQRLKTIPLKETLKKLQISYDDLENDYKEIFLDVACILKGELKDEAISILESCGFHAEIGLRVLEQKSLISISDDNCLQLHDHIEEMGKNIVRGMPPNEPSMHSRLWICEEIEDILVNDLGTKATKILTLRFSNLCPAIIMKGLRKMNKLRFLNIINFHYTLEVSKCLLDSLQCLYWDGCPYRCLFKTLVANNLVKLKMRNSNISQLFEEGEKKVLKKLRFLDLEGCDLRTFDLGDTPNLETLCIKYCQYFEELRMDFECPSLKSVSLTNSKVSKFNLEMTPNLEMLDIQGCEDFHKLHMPVECPKLKFLCLNDSKLSNLNLGQTPNLEKVNLNHCKDLTELRMPNKCPKMKSLYLRGCKLSNINLGLTPLLEELNLAGCRDLVGFHMPFECPKLTFLCLRGTKVKSLNLGLTPLLEMLDLADCYDFVELHMPFECPKLKDLDLSSTKVNSLNLGLTPLLEELRLMGCNDFVEFHRPVMCAKLQSLYLDSFKVSNLRIELNRYHLASLNLVANSRDICLMHPNNRMPKFWFSCTYHGSESLRGNLEKLISLGLCACTNLESFSATICSLQCLKRLAIEGDIPEVPKDLYRLETLEELTLSMNRIKHLPDSICMLKHLKYLNLKSCSLLEQLPSDLGILECLESLGLMDCISLRDIPNSICNMKCLRYLDLSNCNLVEKLPEEFGCLECLEELHIEGAGINHLPQSIFQLKGLQIFGSMWRLKSYGFTSSTKFSTDSAICYVTIRDIGFIDSMSSIHVVKSIEDLYRDMLCKLETISKP